MEEAARLFGTHRNTVRAWLKAGLKAIDGSRPVLILGSELRRFLDERRAKRKCPTPPGMIYLPALSGAAPAGRRHGGLSAAHGHRPATFRASVRTATRCFTGASISPRWRPFAPDST